MNRAFFLVAALFVAGCHSDDSRLFGDWTGSFVGKDGKSSPGANLTLDNQHHWRELFKNLDIEGKWSLSGDMVTMQTELVGGLLVPDAKKRMLANASKTNSPEAYKSMADNLDKPITLTLSADGKQLRRDDPVLGGTAVYTKQ